MKRLKVLITNLSLASRSGTEMYVYHLARQLLRLGHVPVVYAPQLGPLAEELRAASVPIVADLQQISEPPDVIHGHHALETMAALLRFPDSPAIFVCHDFDAWHDRAPRFPRIRRYVAVDDVCRDRLTLADGIPRSLVAVIQNGVDLQKFPARRTFRQQPTAALFLSNYADYRHLRPIRLACQEAGIRIDTGGQKLGGVVRPAEILHGYDLVFAKGRCAWEALCSGASVIVCDANGLGPLVTSDNLESARRVNFGRRLLTEPITPENIRNRIARYDARDAALVTARIRRMADIERIASRLIELYEMVIDEQLDAPAGREAELLAAGEFISWWSRQKTDLIRAKARQYRLSSVIRRSASSLYRRLLLKWRWLDALAYRCGRLLQVRRNLPHTLDREEEVEVVPVGRSRAGGWRTERSRNPESSDTPRTLR